MAHDINPSAKVISSLVQHKHSLSLYAKEMIFSVTAKIIDLKPSNGRMILEMEYPLIHFEKYFMTDTVNIDLEALKGPHGVERETYSLSNIRAKIVKTHKIKYRLECQLPDSVFTSERRGAIRIPLILGMSGRASIEVYPHEIRVEGHLRDLSVGGCMVDVNLSDCIAISIDQSLPEIRLEFPNGEFFGAEGRVRHIRPFGNYGHAAIGIQFINLSTSQTETLYRYVYEAEREAIFRTGISDKVEHPSPLFIPGIVEKIMLQRESQQREKLSRHPPIERDVMNIVYQLQIGLMYIKIRDVFPAEIFYGCADILINLVKQDRKALLHALAFLRDESDWVRQAIKVAGQLADILLLRNPFDHQVREAVLGVLLHTLGKPMLVGVNLPSLNATMTPPQKEILKGHVAALCAKLDALSWEPSPLCKDIIENANEHLDGSGYPAGKMGTQLSGLVRLVSVIKAVNKAIHRRNGISARNPLVAYRHINECGDAYDKAILIEYIRIYGPHPIGTLAKFNGGFLAWIMDVNGRGEPVKVNIVKNIRFLESNIHSVVSGSDLAQLGKLEGIVDPADYGIEVLKI
ncbi:metal-dependent phosphohydrolase [Lonsdalea populi]|uniref:Metal-dependent phosphohydrolase n=1 Tax=Lonsdalea populi TaxID=1172565 RepID=A0A3N0UTB5_9GAMM|nr:MULTISPECIES: PilZ domain-containing protein [Lonsdalea]OSM95395.1 metal-dependent phosphohydrolase [Lonsdalea populi]RAT17698.1 metal-dependent phosphohydrolase [Lonsdalea quercina]RAT29457.1 metal-dependent phosphohydrolase [Lonsdalea populi]RAT35578.1 metal-dependent phosphohydrolase [Lonsdalea populi]RAT49226.1 metal-dependent phosphohydrolase [Lonsdalea populi]